MDDVFLCFEKFICSVRLAFLLYQYHISNSKSNKYLSDENLELISFANEFEINTILILRFCLTLIIHRIKSTKTKLPWKT